MAAEEQPQMVLLPHDEEFNLTETDGAIADFNGFLSQDLSRRAVFQILAQADPSKSFIPKLNTEKVDNPDDLPADELIAVLKGIRRLLISRNGTFLGWQLDFDNGTWQRIEEDKTFKSFFEDKDPDKRKKMKLEGAFNLACAKLGCYAIRFAESNPLESNEVDLPDILIVTQPAKHRNKSRTAAA